MFSVVDNALELHLNPVQGHEVGLRHVVVVLGGHFGYSQSENKYNLVNHIVPSFN